MNMRKLNKNDKTMMAWQIAFLAVSLACLGMVLRHKSPADKIATFALYPMAALAFGLKYGKYLKDDASKKLEDLEKKHANEKAQMARYENDLRNKGILSK